MVQQAREGKGRKRATALHACTGEYQQSEEQRGDDAEGQDSGQESCGPRGGSGGAECRRECELDHLNRRHYYETSPLSQVEFNKSDSQI